MRWSHAFEDFPADARYPQLTSIEDFTVEEGNEMFGRMVRLSAGSYDMICALDYFADRETEKVRDGQSAPFALNPMALPLKIRPCCTNTSLF